MTTTIMRDSIVGDEWIRQTAAANPIQRVIDPKTGLPTGDILTGPVRLAFTDALTTLPQPKPNAQNPKHGVTIMFTPFADFTIIYEEYYKVLAGQFPEYRDPQTGQYHGLHSPFHDQADKVRFGGFTPGLVYFASTSKFKPPVVDTRNNPIVDPAKIYPGVWAICAINPYGYGKSPPQPKKGCGFGIQSVMLIADDTKFGGGAPDTKTLYAGVNVNAPIVRPSMTAGMPMGGQPPAPNLPHVPQTHYTPPVPAANVQPAPGVPANPLPPGMGMGAGNISPPCFCGSGKPSNMCCG